MSSKLQVFPLEERKLGRLDRDMVCAWSRLLARVNQQCNRVRLLLVSCSTGCRCIDCHIGGIDGRSVCTDMKIENLILPRFVLHTRANRYEDHQTTLLSWVPNRSNLTMSRNCYS